MLPFPLDKYGLLLPHKEPDQTSRGKNIENPGQNCINKKGKGRLMGGLSGVTEGWNRQAMAGQTCPLALGATVAEDVGDPCLKFSLSDSSPFTHCLVSHLPCPPKDGKHGYSSPSEPHSPWLPPPNGDLYAPPGLAEEIQ